MGKALSVAPRRQGRSRRGATAGARRGRGVRAALALVALAALLRLVAVQGYRVPSRSMEDTLRVGDYLLVEKLSYGALLPLVGLRLPGLRPPAPGDIVVFRLPEEPGRVYVKRCLATAGQVVEIVDKVVYVDGVRQVDPPFSKYIDARIFPAARSGRDNFGPRQVPAGCLFLVGDNRDNSRDSRHWGFAPVEALVGRGVFVYWSMRPARADEGFFERVRWSRLGAEVH